MTTRTKLLPEMWKLADVARELGVQSHTLVAASQRGRFCPVIQVGRAWYAKAADVRAWFAASRSPEINPLLLDRVRAAGAPLDGEPLPRRPRQPRARTAGSC